MVTARRRSACEFQAAAEVHGFDAVHSRPIGTDAKKFAHVVRCKKCLSRARRAWARLGNGEKRIISYENRAFFTLAYRLLKPGV